MTDTQHLPITFRELFDIEVQNLLSTEVALMQCLHNWMGLGLSLSQVLVFQDYLDMAGVHIEKLHRIQNEQGVPLLSFKNSAVLQLVENNELCMSRPGYDDVKETCLLATTQKINHLKISSFITAAAIARRLAMTAASDQLHDFSEDEKEFARSFLHLSKELSAFDIQ